MQNAKLFKKMRKSGEFHRFSSNLLVANALIQTILQGFYQR